MTSRKWRLAGLYNVKRREGSDIKAHEDKLEGKKGEDGNNKEEEARHYKEESKVKGNEAGRSACSYTEWRSGIRVRG